MWCPPVWNRDVQQEFLEKHIGGAVKFDMTEFTDKTSPTPLMILPQQQFEEKVGKVGNQYWQSQGLISISHSFSNPIDDQFKSL